MYTGRQAKNFSRELPRCRGQVFMSTDTAVKYEKAPFCGGDRL